MVKSTEPKAASKKKWQQEGLKAPTKAQLDRIIQDSKEIAEQATHRAILAIQNMADPLGPNEELPKDPISIFQSPPARSSMSDHQTGLNGPMKRLSYADYAEIEDSVSKKNRPETQEEQSDDGDLNMGRTVRKRIPPKKTKPRSDVTHDNVQNEHLAHADALDPKYYLYKGNSYLIIKTILYYIMRSRYQIVHNVVLGSNSLFCLRRKIAKPTY